MMMIKHKSYADNDNNSDDVSNDEGRIVKIHHHCHHYRDDNKISNSNLITKYEYAK